MNRAITSVLASLLMVGCAVPSSEVNRRFEEASEQATESAAAAATQRALEGSLRRVAGNYVGGSPVELGYKNKLPSAFRDVTLRFADAPNLRVVGERITEVTRLPVAISADIFLSTTAASNSGAAGATSGIAASQAIPMDFRGNLADFLDVLCARLGLGWSYNAGTIDISRFVTRSFQVAASPGAVSYGTRVSKGSATTTGATGGTNSQATGSFTGTSDAAVEATKLSTWEAMKASITSMLTPTIGRVSLNEATGTIVVTDTRMVVDQVARLIELENNLLTRQMTLDVEILTVQADDETQAQLDVNLIHKALSGSWSATATNAGALTTAQAGGLSLNILSGRTSGTSINAKALNGIARVVSSSTTTLVTTNRVPIPLAQFQTTGYLASTTPATGGSTTGGVGVPGLTGGSVTTGLFLSALPTILENNTLLLRLSVDTSTLNSLGSASTGNGETFQQIQFPNVAGYKSDHNVTLRAGDSLVLVGLNSDGTSGKRRTGILGGSLANSQSRSMQVIIVTPRIQAGA